MVGEKLMERIGKVKLLKPNTYVETGPAYYFSGGVRSGIHSKDKLVASIYLSAFETQVLRLRHYNYLTIEEYVEITDYCSKLRDEIWKEEWEKAAGIAEKINFIMYSISHRYRLMRRFLIKWRI